MLDFTDFTAKARRRTMEERFVAARRRALAAHKQSIEAAFRRAVRRVSSAASMGALVRAIQSGDPARIEAVLDWPGIGQPLLDAVLRPTLMSAVGAGGTAEIALSLSGPRAAGYTLDITAPAAIDWLRGEGARALSGATRVRVDALRALLEEAVSAGRTAGQVAREIRDAQLVGLTPAQVRAAGRFREGLRAAGVRGDAAKRSLARFTQRQINHRAETIAIDQTTRAYAAGQQALWAQALKDGLIGERSEVEWVVVDPCELCAPLSGVRIRVGQRFPGGHWPGDRHVRCECMAVLHPA